MKSILFLGRQPKLGLAELESLFGATAVSPLGDAYAACTIEATDIPFQRLGGSIKLCSVIGVQAGTNWDTLSKTLSKLLPLPDVTSHLSADGKLHLGVSAYEMSVSAEKVQATALTLKKALRRHTGQSVRVVPNTAPALSTAQVIHHKLTGDNGIELVLLQHNNQIYVLRTIAEQDITAYTKRDQNRPKRDARVGMLPPKLAQIIINLAVGSHTPHTTEQKATILDPFCGTGVLLQEAALMDYDIYGSDIEPRMIAYSEANLQWLNETHQLSPTDVTLDIGDATSHIWQLENTPRLYVACEGYLGQPFTHIPPEAKLREVTQTCNQIMKGFLKNIAEQIPAGTRLCIAMPAWQHQNGSFTHLKLLDSLDDLGYNRVSFVHAATDVHTEAMCYYRPDQVVARELIVITRK